MLALRDINSLTIFRIFNTPFPPLSLVSPSQHRDIKPGNILIVRMKCESVFIILPFPLLI